MKLFKEMFIFDIFVLVISFVITIIIPDLMNIIARIMPALILGGFFVNIKIKHKQIKEFYIDYYKDQNQAQYAFCWSVVLSYIMLIISIVIIVSLFI